MVDRRLAVGFADLVGFTRLTRRMEEEELGELVEAFETAAADLVAAHGGRLIKTLGDEVLYAADDAGIAAEIALRLIETMANDETMPELRVGIAFGTVTTRMGDVFGTTVNLASRLTSIAPRDAVLVDGAFAEELIRTGDAPASEAEAAEAAATAEKEGEEPPVYRFALQPMWQRPVRGLGGRTVAAGPPKRRPAVALALKPCFPQWPPAGPARSFTQMPTIGTHRPGGFWVGAGVGVWVVGLGAGRRPRVWLRRYDDGRGRDAGRVGHAPHGGARPGGRDRRRRGGRRRCRGRRAHARGRSSARPALRAGRTRGRRMRGGHGPDGRRGVERLVRGDPGPPLGLRVPAPAADHRLRRHPRQTQRPRGQREATHGEQRPRARLAVRPGGPALAEQTDRLALREARGSARQVGSAAGRPAGVRSPPTGRAAGRGAGRVAVRPGSRVPGGTGTRQAVGGEYGVSGESVGVLDGLVTSVVVPFVMVIPPDVHAPKHRVVAGYGGCRAWAGVGRDVTRTGSAGRGEGRGRVSPGGGGCDDRRRGS